MKKIIFIVIGLFISIFFIPPLEKIIAISTNFSVTRRPNSPDGANGWYKTKPEVNVSLECNTGSQGSYGIFISPGQHFLQVYVTTFTSDNGNQYPISYYTIDNSSPSVAAYCNYNINPEGQSPQKWVNAIPSNVPPLGNPVYSDTFKVDSLFDINFIQPTNNSNLTSSPTTVKIGSNSPSGFATVIINNINAINSDGTATATIPLNKGLNTITVKAISVGGYPAYKEITVLLMEQNQPTTPPTQTIPITPTRIPPSPTRSPTIKPTQQVIPTIPPISLLPTIEPQIMGESTQSMVFTPTNIESIQLTMDNKTQEPVGIFETIKKLIFNVFKTLFRWRY